MQQRFFREFLAEGTLTVRVSPGAPKTKVIEKRSDGIWRLAVNAPAHEGQANSALLKFLRKEGKIEAKIFRGVKSRTKVIKVILKSE